MGESGLEILKAIWILKLFLGHSCLDAAVRIQAIHYAIENRRGKEVPSLLTLYVDGAPVNRNCCLFQMAAMMVRAQEFSSFQFSSFQFSSIIFVGFRDSLDSSIESVVGLFRTIYRFIISSITCRSFCSVLFNSYFINAFQFPFMIMSLFILCIHAIHVSESV